MLGLGAPLAIGEAVAVDRRMRVALRTVPNVRRLALGAVDISILGDDHDLCVRIM